MVRDSIFGLSSTNLSEYLSTLLYRQVLQHLLNIAVNQQDIVKQNVLQQAAWLKGDFPCSLAL
jgi:hypothetical protein